MKNVLSFNYLMEYLLLLIDEHLVTNHVSYCIDLPCLVCYYQY